MQKTKANIFWGLSDRLENCNKASLDGDFVTSFTLLSSSAYNNHYSVASHKNTPKQFRFQVKEPFKLTPFLKVKTYLEFLFKAVLVNDEVSALC